MAAADLIRLVESFGEPFGLERSIKITRGNLNRERCLLSVGRSAFGEPPQEKLLRAARALRVPEPFAEALKTSVHGADVIHFGYEEADGRGIHKIYCEYASSAHRAMASVNAAGANAAPTLVHLAYKWLADDPDSHAVTRYTWVPCRSGGELENRLRILVPQDRAPNAHRCIFSLLSRIFSVADPAEVMLMEVEEPDNPRRSCDLNVYDAQMRVHQIADLIEAVAAGLAVPKPHVLAALESAGSKMLGHVSAGIDRHGGEFVTAYFGVEAH
jgi:tryptophan halogenase